MKKFKLNSIYTKERPLSWSAISSFEYDPEQWYTKYVLNLEAPATQEMLFGSEVGRRLAEDPKFLPHVPRFAIFEYEMRAMFGKIPLIGYADGYNPGIEVPKFGMRGYVKTIPELGEYKTGKKEWDQKRADTHGQIDMYLLLLWLTKKIRPEDARCRLFWLPTQDNGDFTIGFIDEKRVHEFETKRTMKDILRFGKRINDTYKAMELYAQKHLSESLIIPNVAV